MDYSKMHTDRPLLLLMLSCLADNASCAVIDGMQPFMDDYSIMVIIYKYSDEFVLFITFQHQEDDICQQSLKG